MGYDNIRVGVVILKSLAAYGKNTISMKQEKQHRQEDVITMYLEPNRDDRDYLYGRLLALADNFEESVLRKQGVQGPSNQCNQIDEQFHGEALYDVGHIVEAAYAIP